MAPPQKFINPVIGDRIKQARKSVIVDEKSLTQKELAEALNVSCQAVKNWEQHINEPDLRNLKRISEICNVDFVWLLSF